MSRRKKMVLGALLVALLLRLAFGLGYWVDKPLTHDEREYLMLAQNLRAGHGLVYDDDGLLPNSEASRLYQQLIYWHSVTQHVYHTAYRRVVEGESVPNVEKLFSLFEPDTELIIRGKAGSPIEFGHKVMVIEDAVGFICHWKGLPIGVDERDMLLPEMRALQERLKNRIRRASFDRGFHSPKNQEEMLKVA